MKVYTVGYTFFGKRGEILESYLKKVFSNIEDANKYMLDIALANSENFYTLANCHGGVTKTLRITYTDSEGVDGELAEFYMKEREVE